MKSVTHFPRLALADIVNGFGGIGRDEAILAANEQLESMRGDATRMIEESLSAIEVLCAAPQAGSAYSAAQLSQMLVRCDQIVTLAGTFGYKALDDATRYLCDLADGLLRSGTCDVASVTVHVRTMRLLAPGSPPLAAGHQDRVLSELGRILAHHGYPRANDLADKALAGG